MFTENQIDVLKKFKYAMDYHSKCVMRTNDGHAESCIRSLHTGVFEYEYIPNDYPNEAEITEFNTFEELVQFLSH